MKSNSGIRRFIERCIEILDDTTLLERENVMQEHNVDGKMIDDIDGFVKGFEECHIHSIVDGSEFRGIIDVLKKNHVPVVYFCHSLIKEEIESSGESNIQHEHKRKAQEELFEKADKIVFFNNHHMKKVVEENPGIVDKCVVLYHGVEKKESSSVRDKKKILYVGRISKEKGVIELAKAFKKLGRDDVCLEIIGNDERSRSVDEVRKILKGCNFEIVDWINDEDKLGEHYRNSSLIVLPSHYDSFNMIGIEGLSYGVPLLVSDIPVFREIYIEKGLADCFRSKDVSALSKAIEEMIEKPADSVELPEEYSMDNFARCLKCICLSLCSD